MRRVEGSAAGAVAILLWGLAVGGVALFASFVTVKAQGVAWLPAFAGLWVEAAIAIPAVLLVGFGFVTLRDWPRRKQPPLPVPLPHWLWAAAAPMPLLWLVLAFWPATWRTPTPDVVVLMIDTLRHDFVTADRTPALHQLRGQSIRFEQAVSEAPWTLPAVASMLTGRPPEIHGASAAGKGIDAELATVATAFREAGYETVGLVSNPHLTPTSGLHDGFDHWAHVSAWDLPYPLSSLTTYRTAAAPAELQWKRASLYTRFVRDPDRPLFLFLHFMDPHQPWEASGRELRAERRAHPDATPDRLLYGAAVRELDDGVGDWIDELRRIGRFESTILAVLSDHGEEIDDGRSWSDPKIAEAGHGHSLLPEVIRVPFFIRLPGGAPAGACGSVVSTRRLAATLLELAGVEHDRAFGSPLVDRDGACSPDVPATFQGATLRGPSRVSSRDARYTTIVDREDGSWRVFDRVADPEHRAPLGQVPPVLRAAMGEHLRSLDVGALPEKEPAEINPALQQQLRALGYLD